MKKQVSVLFFTERGFEIAKKMRDAFLEKKNQIADGEPELCVTLYKKGSAPGINGKSDAVFVTTSLHDWCADVFAQSSALIFVGAAGIAVRTIAPFLVSKAEDPAVLVADERGKHVISLLSGHLGGGNELTLFLAKALGADPVITTASDVGGKLAIDVWAQKNGLYITDLKAAKAVAARIVGGCAVPFYSEGRVPDKIPPELVRVETIAGQSELGKISSAADISSLPVATDCLVTVSVSEPHRNLPESISEPPRNLSKVFSAPEKLSDQPDVPLRLNRDCAILHLVPRAVVLGIGCKKGKSAREIHNFVFNILNSQRIVPQSIAAVASIDLKSGEAGLLELAAELGVPFVTFSAEELRAVPGEYSSSGFVSSVTGVDNVCERAAMAVLNKEEQKKARFLCRKTVGGGVTVALLERPWEVAF
ncbi:MAG: cobalamin biosynthesis protein [Clostridiales bacterium]|nr:cobalamin biosynthesis protein [Clostridiales bacterium]